MSQSFEGVQSEVPRRNASHPLRCAWRLAGLLLLATAGRIILRTVRLRFSDSEEADRRAMVWTQRWFQVCRRVMGLRVSVRGDLPPRGSLLTPNHIGYVDTIVMGTLVPNVQVTRREVLDWPILGPLIRLSGQIALQKDSLRTIQRSNEEMADHLRRGHRLTIYLEGTTTPGYEVLPFKSSLLQSAIETNAPCVPVALRWSAEDESVDIHEEVAFWRDNRFRQHLLRLLGLNGLCCEVTFGEPVQPEGYTRPELARVLHERVTRMVFPEVRT